MSSPRLRAVFARRLRAVGRELPGVLAGDVEAVHKMRVSSRRLRESVPLLSVPGLSGEPDARAARKLARALRRVTRALGGVRELDVALGFLAEIGAARPALRAPIGIVERVIRWEREIRRRAMIERLDRIDLKRLHRRIAARLVDVDVSGLGPSWKAQLGQRVARRADEIDAAVQAAGALYAPGRVHSVRIATKKLRYALELAGELAAVPALGSVRRLKRMQDLLGRMHDLEVLSGYSRLLDLQARPPGRGQARIDRLLDAIDKEIRLLHADYLANRDVLAGVTARCRTEYCPLLESPVDLDASRGPRNLRPVESYGRKHHNLRRATRRRGGTGRPVSR
jgi:CHAD domain-containing protein